MELVILGSGGGPQPIAERGAPAVAVVYDGIWYAVDAGNGVARQAVAAGLELRDLRGVFITHHHIDHSADLGNLPLLAWTAGLVSPIMIAGPPPCTELVREFLSLNRVDIGHRQDLGRPEFGALLQVQDVSGTTVVLEANGLTVRAGDVVHPPLQAVGYRFDAEDASIVISGDTAACDEMVALAGGADVLVHEAYSPDHLHLLTDGTNAAVERLQHHFAQAHTSAEDAGRVATRAGVRTLVLWHLIPTRGVSDEEFAAQAAREFDGQIIVAKDLERIATSRPTHSQEKTS